MMTDREKLEKIKEMVMSQEDSYARMKKENVLEKLMWNIDDKTGQLVGTPIIPIYEHDVVFMKETLEELGYSPNYEKEYNPFWQQTCYKVTL